MKKVLQTAVLCLFMCSCMDTADENKTTSYYPDVLNIKSDEAFLELIGRVTRSQKNELDKWEADAGFVSMRTVLANAHSEWLALDDEAAQQGFLEKYHDILRLDGDAIVPILDNSFYQAITNRQGLYRSGDFLSKVIDDHVISVNVADGRMLSGIEKVSDVDKTSGKFRVMRFRGMDQSNGRVQSACSTYLEDSYYLNPGGCRDDREAFVSAESYLAYNVGAPGITQPMVKIRVWGRMRNGWCTWYNYETQLEWRNVSFSIWARERLTSSPGGTTSQAKFVSVSIPDESTSTDAENLVWDREVGDWVRNESIAAQAFSAVHAEGKSRGVDNNWPSVTCP